MKNIIQLELQFVIETEKEKEELIKLLEPMFDHICDTMTDKLDDRIYAQTHMIGYNVCKEHQVELNIEFEKLMNEIENSEYCRQMRLPDGRIMSVIPLTFGRGRVHFSRTTLFF